MNKFLDSLGKSVWRYRRGSLMLSVFLFSFALTYRDPSRNLNDWINRWSVLLTGFAAIAAALITVGEMRKAEKNSEDRHRQLVGLQLRADKLRVRRAAYPQCDDLDGILAELWTTLARLEEKLDPAIDCSLPLDEICSHCSATEENRNECDRVAEEIARCASIILQVMQREDLTVAYELFDAKMNTVFREVKETCRRIQGSYMALNRPQPYSHDATVPSTMIHRGFELYNKGKVFAAELRNLSRLYGD